MTAVGDAEQPIQWSSEYNDEELGLAYYNYRFLNPSEARWLSRDLVREDKERNGYSYLCREAISGIDFLGLMGKIPYYTIPYCIEKERCKNGYCKYKCQCIPPFEHSTYRNLPFPVEKKCNSPHTANCYSYKDGLPSKTPYGSPIKLDPHPDSPARDATPVDELTPSEILAVLGEAVGWTALTIILATIPFDGILGEAAAGAAAASKFVKLAKYASAI